MAQQSIDTARLPRLDGGRIAILTSKWYPEFVGPMLLKCQQVLESKGVEVIEVHELPGTLEMPFAAQQLIESQDLVAVICLSVVLQGDTKHFDMIVNAVGTGLVEVARSTGTPVINEILPVNDIDQAVQRTGDDKFNKGIEAAAAALEIVHWQRRTSHQKA